ncbi:MAG: response regulator transcription factor, partial [Chloroflexota bacterium]
MPPIILVVDDERATRLSLSDILRLDEYDVQTAASGAEAVQLLAAGQIDLMLLDIKMPGMDGMQVLAEARRLSPQTVVILLTAHGTLDTAMQAIDEQAFAYLLKPSAPEAILDKVRRGLARRTVSPPLNKPGVVSGGGLQLDFARHEITVSGKRLHLTPAEFKLLAAMMTHADEVISSQRLVREGQGYQVA